jgi:hypothetical protein
MATANQHFIREISFAGLESSKANATAGTARGLRHKLLMRRQLAESAPTSC